MSPQVIEIPKINDSPEDFTKLFVISNSLEKNDLDVVFKFDDCSFLRPNAVAFLGGLARQLEKKGRKVTFDWNSLGSKWVRTTLCQNGFAGEFGYPSIGWPGESIPYREDYERAPNSIMDYLQDNWLERGWVLVSNKLRDAIVGHVWEIYNNAFEHTDSYGIFSCGQHFSHHNDLVLSVVDFGGGIPDKVRDYLCLDPRAEFLTSAGCLRWAFQRGNTTKTDEPGGLGLDLLKEFVALNQGKLEVYSNDGYAIVDSYGERYEGLQYGFRGTIVHITLRCDEKLYRFAHESLS